MKNPNSCEVCGIDIYTTCGLCKAPVHYFPHKCGKNGKNCFLNFHSDNFFGLARTYVDLIGKKKGSENSNSFNKKA